MTLNVWPLFLRRNLIGWDKWKFRARRWHDGNLRTDGWKPRLREKPRFDIFFRLQSMTDARLRIRRMAIRPADVDITWPWLIICIGVAWRRQGPRDRYHVVSVRGAVGTWTRNHDADVKSSGHNWCKSVAGRLKMAINQPPGCVSPSIASFGAGISFDAPSSRILATTDSWKGWNAAMSRQH